MTYACFQPTEWSLLRHVKSPDPGEAQAALEKLCAIYWPALYSYIRRKGHSPEDAKDLTQSFLSRLIQKDWLSRHQDRRSKFRSFLLKFLEHFLSDERDRAGAQKRGGGSVIIPLDAFEAEERAAFEPADHTTPEQAYSRRWARSILAQALNRLEAEYNARGKGHLCAALKELNPGVHGEQSYRDVGERLGMSEQAVKSAVFAFRRRYAVLLREVISDTVADREQLEQEVRELIAILA
jgi:RNA polymerase sigma factor (sigma-70 family)